VGIRKLGYVGLNVTGVDAWREMLSATFGVASSSAKVGTEDVLLAELDQFNYRLALYPSDQDTPRHIGWILDSVSELDRISDRLNGAGYEVHKADVEEAATRGADALSWFTDPVGYRVELAVGQAKGRADVERPPGARAGVTGLGHLVLASPKLNELRDLYENVLEFKLTDYRAPGLFFFRCNSTHHSIALASADQASIHHLELEHASIDDVGRAHDRAVANDVPVSISLGRHMNDKAISFYVQTPSGFHLEIACGGIEVGDDWVPHDFGTADVWGHHHAFANPFSAS
jgi:2,3-dihydroxybiphenyl 1,2-dioxygenase